ncbi:MAG: carboxypeptidase regulatory-like domain-containing protein [Acidobacteriota bacterium]
MVKKSFLIAFSISLIAILMSGIAHAQGTTSRVTGVVTDASGAAIAGATVTLTNEGTNISITAQTSDSGAYTFDLIQIGKYQVTVEKPGFKKFVSKGNTANINQPATVNVTLEAGDVSATVTVNGSAEQVQTSTSGNIGSTVEQRTLESLPIVGLRGRNPLDLLNFQPGVVFGGNTGGAVNVNGSRDRAFNFTLDGIDINESTAGGSNFTPLRPNPDSVQEFQIVTSNFTAELGRSSGAAVTLVTRSGTNQFHGNLFEYYQTPELNAVNYPNTIQTAIPKDQFVQHIFGGSFGGPLPNLGLGEGTPFKLLKDRAFFFVNLQLLRAYDTALVQRTVYTQAARAGLFRYVLGGQNGGVGTSNAAVDAAGNPIFANCPQPAGVKCISSYNVATQAPVSIDPSLQALINAMPLPNDFSGGDGLNTALFDFASPQHERQYDFSTKLDFRINDKNSMYIRWAQGDQNSFGDSGNGGRPIFPNSPNFVDTFRSPRNLAVNWRWAPTSTISNEAIFGWSKYFFNFLTPHPDASLPFVFLNPATPNTNFSYNARGVRTLQFIDNLTIVHADHTLKTGINFRFNQHRDDRSNVAGAAIEPTVTFSGANVSSSAPYNIPVAGSTSINSTDRTRLINMIADELGLVGSVSQAFVLDPNNPSSFAPVGSRWLNEANYVETDYYVQDNWRVRRNLVLDLGVRWEPKYKPSIADRTILVPNQPVKLGAAPSNTLKWVPGDLFKNDFSKILPSIGFAWDPFKSGKTSIRANYRMASDRFATFLFGSSIFQSTPGNNVGVTNSGFGAGGGLLRNVGPVIASLVPTQTPASLQQPPKFGTGSISVIDPDLQYPQIHEWSASFQREIGDGNVVEVNYIGKHGVHLLGGYNVNQANIFASVPGVGGTFLQEFNQIRANAAYNSPLINLIMSGNATNNGGTARFRTLNSTALSAGNATGGVASAALVVSQKTCVAADVTAGICTNGQLGQRLLDLYGFSSLLQPYSQFTGGLNVFDSSDYSLYNGLQLIFKRRIKSGLGFQLGYTYSLSKDNRSWDPSLSTVSTGSSQSASSTPFDLRDRHLNYAWSDFDRRHVFQGTYVYELPFGKEKWIHPENKVVNYLIGGWQLAGTVIWMSGRPFTVYSGANTVSSVVQSTANCSGCTRDTGRLIVESGRNFWFDSAARALFSTPDPGSIGNTGRNFFLEPAYFQTDASVSKKWGITEKVHFDLRLDIRNVTNTPDFAAPTAVVGNSLFGRINGSINNASRRMQLSGKISF